MGTFKDGLDAGLEAIQFWTRFKGRRVRVWPSELTVGMCSAAGLWVAAAQRQEPSWWEESRRRYKDQATSTSDILVQYAVEHLADASLPNIETVEEAKLLEGMITDVIKTPPGIYLTDIHYWVVAGDRDGKRVQKVKSIDEGMFLPLANLARIDFVPPGPSAAKGKSSWSTQKRPRKVDG